MAPLRAALALAAALAALSALSAAHAQENKTQPPSARPALAIALAIRSRAIQDSRCYLMNGGAVESFFISEDTPVGSVIGTLSVNGNPSEDDGDITLRIQERGAAVGIAAGTKNITLLRALDREERLGPSSVYVNVRCDRRHTTDPSFVIPVSVRVWDVNDNAPAWVGAPYRAALSELAAVGARVLAAPARDPDQPGPHATVHYAVLPGPHSEYIGFANELDSTLVVKKPLDYESVRNFTVTLRAQDQGSPPLHNDTTLAVQLLDADDQNPRFSHDHYTATVPDGAQEGTVLETSPGPISAVDQDVGINAPLTYSTTGEAAHLVQVDKDTGVLRVTQNLLDSKGLPLTLVVKATQVDNPDRYALATVGVTGGGGGGGGGDQPLRFSRTHYSVVAPEDAPAGTLLATLHTTPHAAQTRPLQFYVSERGFLDKFAINARGELLLRAALDYEDTPHYHYRVMVTDGHHNDTATVNITVGNVNEWEPRFRYPQYEFRVDEPSAGRGSDGAGSGSGSGSGSGHDGLLAVGKLDVHDGDTSDTVTITLRGADAGMFYVSPEGEMFLRSEALRGLNSSLVHLVATAVDSGAPPRQTSVPVVVRLRAAEAAEGGSALAGAPLLALFAAALALLALLLAALLLHLHLHRARRRRAKNTAGSAIPGVKPPSSALAGGAGGAGGGGSLVSVSAGASSILAASTSSLDLRTSTLQPARCSASRQSQRFPNKSKVAPAPPTLPSPAPSTHATPPANGTAGGAGGAGGTGPALTATEAAAAALMSDHLHSRSGVGRSGVAWPSATIPARVKKLSWDDAAHHTQGGESVAEATNPAVGDHMNLTVYF